jgi:hypothetical protein
LFPNEYIQLIEDNSNEFAANATTYNNILAFASIGVRNDTGGGFQHGYTGNHNVTIRGHTYHVLHDQSSTNPSSGLGLMFFENSSSSRDIVSERNDHMGASSLPLN